MAKKEPKTMRGIQRKLMTGDGRKKSSVEKFIEGALGKEKQVKKAEKFLEETLGIKEEKVKRKK